MEYIFYLAVCSSLLSNLPFVLDAGLDEPLKLVWMLPFFFLLIYKDTHIIFHRRILSFIFFVMFFFFYCLMCQSIFGIVYLGAEVKNICLCLFIYITSYAFWSYYGDIKVMYRLSWLLLYCGAILAFAVFVGSLMGVSIEQKEYAFHNKNSMATILFCCGLIPFFILQGVKKMQKLFIYAALMFIFIVIFLLKSRATIVGVFFVFLYVVTKVGSIKYRVGAFFIFVCLLVVVLFNPHYYDIIVNNIIFAGNNASDIDAVSSGRVHLVNDALNEIPKHLWFGRGLFYLDCMPIAVIYQYGICGALLIFGFIFYVAVKVSKRSSRSLVDSIVFLLFWVFMINSLFEANPPFGPGVKCFLLWLTMGISSAEEDRENNLYINKLS